MVTGEGGREGGAHQHGGADAVPEILAGHLLHLSLSQDPKGAHLNPAPDADAKSKTANKRLAHVSPTPNTGAAPREWAMFVEAVFSATSDPPRTQQSQRSEGASRCLHDTHSGVHAGLQRRVLDRGQGGVLKRGHKYGIQVG